MELTARLFALPISLLSLVDAELVAYPGSVGMPDLPPTLPRSQCICAVAVYQLGLATVFENLREQPCQWISAEAQASYTFYASFRLMTRATQQPIGTLCVLDVVQRTFGAPEQQVLAHMAGIALRLLDLELLAPPAVAPALWANIGGRVHFALQRIATLTALSRWEASPLTASARSYQSSLHEERSLLVQDVDYQVSQAYAGLAGVAG